MYINIANIKFVLKSNFFRKLCAYDSFWKQFVNCEQVNDNLDFDIEYIEKENYIHGAEYYEIRNDAVHIHRINADIMLVNKEWRKIWILPAKNMFYINRLLFHIFYIHASQNKTIQFHSALIEREGRGIMFLGPSGIGKTTQAELWEKYRDALIINGDIVFIQKTGENFLGWGTPWHGSSPYCKNTSTPIYAMIVLKQASENFIRELFGFEKVSAISNNVFYPHWLENGMELCLETLDHLLSKIPVYELSCRPDEDAVRLVEETVFK